MPKPNLLIVDDEDLLLELMLEDLTESGYHVKGANSVPSAIDELKTSSFDCIVLDLNLTGCSGKEVVEFLKQNRTNPNHKTPVIIASGVLEDDMLAEIDSMAQDYITKPFTNDSLVQKIKRCIQNSPHKKRAA